MSASPRSRRAPRSRTAWISRSTSGPTTPPSKADLAVFRRSSAHAGVFLDFDGSLAEIVPHPDLAAPVENATEVVEALVSTYSVVAIVTGRRAEDISGRLPIAGLTYLGVYGMEDFAADLLAPVEPAVERAALVVPEAWVERKGVSLAVHLRGAPDAAAARAALLVRLQEVATDHGLRLVDGKAVLELLPADLPMKGGAVDRTIGERGLTAALFAGDDVADLEAFEALDALERRDGLLAIRVAVRGPETPVPLLEAADEVVDGPAGLVRLLGQLT